MNIYVSATWGQKTIDWCKQNDVYYMQNTNLFIKNSNIRYALDNGAFKKYRENTDKTDFVQFYETLGYILDCEMLPDFVAVPDIVGDGIKSFKFSLEQFDLLPKEFNYYFVIQDGMSTDLVKDIMYKVSGIFVGGTKQWKLRMMKTWIDFAHNHNKPCHIGRMSTFKDMDRAFACGADSIDGSTLVRNQRLYEINLWRDYVKCQKRL
jgi:hypothetical protein